MSWISRVLVAVLLGFIWVYQKMVSPFIPPRCRYQPTCSSYAKEAIELHGGLMGTWLAIKRVMRCHPLGGSGYDPVPPKGGAPIDRPTKAPMCGCSEDQT